MEEDGKPCLNVNEEDIPISEEERAYIKKMLQKLIKFGMAGIYGDEDNKEEEVLYDHDGRKDICKAVCCSFNFALTKEEVEKGIIKWNREWPYFISKDEDGYCSHLNRETLVCEIWEDRPQRCRKYDCRKDPNVWNDWEKGIINKEAFKHLPEKD
ncbi:MAG: YkgJ family cysteine cluster protein [Nitrospirae bacterium]|jgi:Fe-S-cluster containining protein|nr:YkgJ family cysteine cluster protein [Nitrospirota bacterium]